MNENKKSLIGKVALVMISVLVVFLFLAIGVSVIMRDNKSITRESISSGWDCYFKDFRIENVDISKEYLGKIKKYDKIRLVKKISKTESDMIYPVIDIKSNSCSINVYLDGEKIGGNYNKNKKNNSISRNMCVELPEDYGGKKLELEIGVQKAKTVVLLDSIHIMSEMDYVIYQIRSNVYFYILGSFMLIFGFSIAIIVLCVNKRSRAIKRIFWVGMSLFFVGIAILAQFNIIDIFFDNAKITQIMKYASVFLSIPCVININQNIRKDRMKKIVFSLFCIVISIATIIFAILDYIGKMVDCDIIIFECYLIGITSIMLLIFSIKDVMKKEMTERIIHGGLIVCYTLILVDVICSQFVDYILYQNINKMIIIITVGVFIHTVVISYVFKTKEYMDNITEQRILTTLAYTDPLTGIENRTKYEEIFKEIMGKDMKKNHYVICSFDLNNLKAVNDNMGHEVGDVYIKEFAKILKEKFVGEKFVGRIGGDEFLVVIENRKIKFDSIVTEMLQKFKNDVSKKGVNIQASFAYGYAESEYEKVSNIQELLDIADKRMYECKKEQKIRMVEG